MLIPPNIIANADDLGLSQTVNKAILNCFDQSYINSASFLTNTPYFQETVNLIHENKSMRNIGVHVNLAEFKPVTNFKQYDFLDEDGNWNFKKVNKKFSLFNKESRDAFRKEIHEQIDKALSCKIPITHLDSHCHIHTLPSFFNLFTETAKHYNLKLRLAQTYYEGNTVNFLYRKLINNLLKLNNSNYSNYVETVDYFLKTRNDKSGNGSIEIVLHPDLAQDGKLTDHFDNTSVPGWVNYLKTHK
ncbi:MAG: ChbG/HpnK family deacetylase [Mucilaginibacter sp.]